MKYKTTIKKEATGYVGCIMNENDDIVATTSIKNDLNTAVQALTFLFKDFIQKDNTQPTPNVIPASNVSFTPAVPGIPTIPVRKCCGRG